MINEFRASFKEELAKPSRFRVRLIPLGVTPILNQILDDRTLTFRCESASLPGRSIATADHRIYGPTEKYPYQSIYDDISLTFICTDSMLEKKFFDQWMEIINPQTNWNMSYKSDYAMNVQIEQYDNADNVTYAIELVDAFPLSVNELGLDWSSTDSYHKLSVTFAYTYWTNIVDSNGYEPQEQFSTSNFDGQINSFIPSLLQSDTNRQRTGTYLNVTNQAIGAFDTAKDQLASTVNKSKQSLDIMSIGKYGTGVSYFKNRK
jgi:hypothetical protein